VAEAFHGPNVLEISDAVGLADKLREIEFAVLGCLVSSWLLRTSVKMKRVFSICC